MLEAASENYAQIMYAIVSISSPYEKLKAIASGVLDYILYLGPAVIRKSLELQFAGTKEMTGHEQPSDFGKLVCSFFLQAPAAGEIRKNVPALDLMHASGFMILGIVQIWAVNGGTIDLKKVCLYQFDVLVRPDSFLQ